MNYSIQEVAGEEKPFKVIDANGKQVAQADERRKAEKFIAYRVANEPKAQ